MDRRGLMMAGAGTQAGSLVGGATPARAGATVVVLELFTSQGCSSCPPADRLLGELVREPSVIALAWHVDYWNGLGWPDPFATRLATDRQRAYAQRLGEDVYTPALVIGGARMAVGSDRGAIATAIHEAAPPPVPVSLERAGGEFVAAIGPAGTPVSGVVAFYDPEHLTSVARGENGGRRLQEYRIVRQAMPIDRWDGSQRRLTLAAPPSGQGAVLMVQGADLRILGAADLRPAVSG